MDTSITSINNISEYLRLVSGEETLVVGPTDGKRTIAGEDNVFTGHINSDFKSWGLDVKGNPCGPTKVAVHEIIKDGNFQQIFSGLSPDLNSLCLEQDQVLEFVKHRSKWLRTDRYATFFLCKADGEFFVASVFFDGYSRLIVSAHRLSFGHVWFAGFRLRVVVPQLTLAN